jgi:hypothetical protein
MRQVCLILFFLFCFFSHATLRYSVENEEQLKRSVFSIIYYQLQDPRNFSNYQAVITLKQGYYKISPYDNWFLGLLEKLRKETLYRASQLRLKVQVKYQNKDIEVLSDTGMGQGLSWLDKQLKSGLKVTQWVRYSCYNDTDFLHAIEQAAVNNADTIIKLYYCSRDNCMKSFLALEKLKQIRMQEPDGMHLRIESRFLSKEKLKAEFFQEDFSPFIIMESSMDISH